LIVAPSMADHSQSMPLSESYSASISRHTSTKTPAFTHWLYRRWQVVPEPNSRGSARHWQPVRSRYTTPARTRRAGAGGRPPFGLGFSGGSSGSTAIHNVSGTSANLASIAMFDHAAITSASFEIGSKACCSTGRTIQQQSRPQPLE